MQNGNTGTGPILLDACPDYGFSDKADEPYTIIPPNYTPGQTLFITHESNYADYNADMSLANDYLASKKIPVLYDSTSTFVGNKTNLMGYISWGSNDTHYDARSYNSLRFSPGGICETAVSTSARTFLPTTGGQSLIDDLISQGVTGVKGYTDEPLLQGIASPSVLFNRYTRGWTLAESFYAASKLVGWMGIVIGDPICRAYADSISIPAGNKTVFYPNPSVDVIHVNVDGDYNYKIFNSAGRLVSENKLINKQISVRDLSVGVYIIMLSNGHSVISSKVIRSN
jgi:hypothetical protein